MKKSNVYTRTGDMGETSLASGRRVRKCCSRLESYGTIDELNSHLGLLLTDVKEEPLRERIIRIQHRLFEVGAILASEPDGQYPTQCRITAQDVADLEHDIDATSDGLPGWRGFTLPGGCRGAAQAHVARTVCRRAERCILSLAENEPVDPQLLAYVNRISDFLYVLACRLNFFAGTEEILWQKRTI